MRSAVMRAASILGFVAVGGSLAGYLWSVANRSPHESPAPLDRDSAVRTNDAAPIPQSAPPPAPAAPDLEAMSPTFRNTTFLIEIRDAGYACEDVVAAHRTTSDVWLASCRDLHGYTISVDESGALAVAPIPHYFDGIGPMPIQREDRFRLDRDPSTLLPQTPQPLPPR